MYEEYIACIDYNEKGHYFVWKPWTNVPYNSPIIFWTEDVRVLLNYIDFSNVAVSEEDREKLMSDKCFPITLERNKTELWIG